MIALDYEQTQGSFNLPTSPEGTFSNINMLKLGIESQLFSLPFWMRTGLTFMFKPTVSGFSASTQDSINKAFKYGVLPVRFDLGSTLNLWSYEFGSSLGLDVTPLISSLQFDTNNLDLTRTLYYNLSLKKDAWEISYLSKLDALLTASAYSNKAADASGKKSFAYSDAKFIQTLGVTYRF